MAPSNPIPNPPPLTDHYENPYYLHNTDHAGLQLVTDRLSSGADFHSWRRSVRMALNVRNKLGFVDGTIRKPPDDSRDSGSWSRCNDMVATWLMNSVDKKIGGSLLFMNTAEAIWNNLMTRFKQDDAPRVYEIEQRLSTIQQGSLDVSTYYTELITLWEEYKNYIELPVCTCGRCECNAALLWEKMQQRGRVTKFLMGLNEVYEQIRRNILMLKPIPTIEEAYKIVAQDERQRAVKPVVKVENVVFQTTGSHNGGISEYQDNMEYAAAYNTFRPRGNRPLCTHCGQLGHTINKCFKLHGYPPGFKPYSGNSTPRPSFTPRGPTPYTPRPSFQPMSNSTKAVANVFTDITNENSISYSTHAARPTSLDVSQFSSAQIQSLINQLNTHVHVPDPVLPGSSSSITEHGVMAPQSSSGPFSGTDDWEG